MKKIEKTISLEEKLFYYKISNNFYNDLGNNVYLAKDYLIHKYINLDEIKIALDKRIENINETVDNLKNVNIYLYYIESDEDINFQNNQKTGIYDYIINNISDNITYEKFSINDFDDYKSNYYRTDHHWDYRGSYRGYLELLNMFKIKDSLIPTDTSCISTRFSGSKSTMLGSSYLDEKFCFYKFDIPNHIVKENGTIVDNYGDKNLYYRDEVTNKFFQYGGFYGDDYGLVEFDFTIESKPNLLILGNSFDNAISDLLASHFNKTFLVDLRHYKRVFGKEFNIKSFVKENNINNVLFIGNGDFYIQDDFNIKGGF